MNAERVGACGRYGGELRRLAIRVKGGEASALRTAAALLAERLPCGAVVVPMPSHRGRAEAMLGVAERVGALRPDVAVCDALEAAPHGGRYAAKRDRRDAGRVRMRMRLTPPSARQIVVIDNCVDAGATFRAARAALPPGASLLALAATDAWGVACASGADGL